MNDTYTTPSIKQIVKENGGSGNVARAITKLGKNYVTPQLVIKWTRDNRISAKHVLAFCKVTGCKPWEISPEIYPKDLFVTLMKA